MKTYIRGNCKTYNMKSNSIKKLINEALYIIDNLGVPIQDLTSRRLERMAMAFLAVIDVNNSNNWNKAKDINSQRAITSREIIEYINKNFNENISSGSYDDIRRKDLSRLVEAGIICKGVVLKKNSKNIAVNVNDSSRGNSLNAEYTQLIRSYGSEGWEKKVESFLKDKVTLSERFMQKRDLEKMNVKLPNSRILEFTLGGHNHLQKLIIEEFLPRFGFNAEVLYVGDAANKYLFYEKDRLEKLGFFNLQQGELPDIVAYSKDKNWIYVFEAVYTCNPVTISRKLKIEELTKECTADIIYISAFLDKDTFRKHVANIAWETEAWIADNPDHMVHFNGDKFMGPYAKK